MWLMPDIQEQSLPKVLVASYPPLHHLRVECPQSLQDSELLPLFRYSRYLLLFFVTKYHVCPRPPISAQGIWKLKVSVESVLIIQPVRVLTPLCASLLHALT